jgi:NADP-dependent 3-hydroxy acid dehydrogenase YdfG
MDNQKEKTWFITGASKGIGFALVKLLLENGHKVAATSRNKKSIEEKIGKNNPNLLTLTVDITNDSEVRQAINETVNKFGKIDVAVNNAGYLLLGSLEEVSAQEFQQSLNVNVNAFLNVIRNVLPYFRKQKSGHIFNFSSSAGYSADAGAGSYNAVKSTVIALSEALAAEVKPYNVKVTIVSPGFFRTSFLEKDAFSTAQNRIEDYNTQLLIDGMGQMSGNQTGDPEKLVKVLMNIEGTEDAPLHLLMGQDAYERATNYYQSQLAALEKHKDLSFSTNFD